LIKINSNKEPEFAEKIVKAVDFHGHLGPFLVIGVRMGIIGMRELGLMSGNDERLRVMVYLKYSVPISCVVDGLQVTTRCTIGNQKLKIVGSSDIAAKLMLNNGKEVTVAVDSAVYDRLKSQLLSEKKSSKEVERLAHQMASMPEEDMFVIKRNF